MAELMATGGFIGAAPGSNEHNYGAAMRLTQQHSWPGAVSRISQPLLRWSLALDIAIDSHTRA